MWTWQAKGDHKIVTLTIEAKSPFHDGLVKYSMYYQGWTWGACSCASLWDWAKIPQRVHNEETLAGFIKMLLHEVQPAVSSWNPHRVFAQIPASGRDAETGEYNEPSHWFEYVISNVYPDIKPAYEFRNRSHKSTVQRLFDLDTDQMLAWLEKYNAKQQSKVSETRAAVSSPNVGTIINSAAADHGWGLPPQVVKLNNDGQRPIAKGEYFNR